MKTLINLIVLIAITTLLSAGCAATKQDPVKSQNTGSLGQGVNISFQVLPQGSSNSRPVKSGIETDQEDDDKFASLATMSNNTVTIDVRVSGDGSTADSQASRSDQDTTEADVEVSPDVDASIP